MLARSQKCLQYIGLVLISTEVEIPGNRKAKREINYCPKNTIMQCSNITTQYTAIESLRLCLKSNTCYLNCFFHSGYVNDWQ
jgi:hypothetical protein